MESLVLKRKDKKSASIALKRRSSSYLSVDADIFNKSKKDIRKGSVEQNRLLLKIGEFSPIPVSGIREKVEDLESLLKKHVYYDFENLKKKINKKEPNAHYSKEEVSAFKDEFTHAIYKIPDHQQNEDVESEVFFSIIKNHIYTLTEEDNIFNQQFKDKTRLFQCLIDPIILGIKKKHNKFAVFQNAIRGKLSRDREGCPLQ